MLIFLAILFYATAFKFYLPGNEVFCFSEDLSSQTLSVVNLKIDTPLEFSIKDPDNDMLYKTIGTDHKFSFTALNSGIYSYCIDNTVKKVVQIDFDLKSGVKAKDYSGIAGTKDLKSIELKLRKLEDQSKDIHKKLQFLREREEQMRNTNLTIHNRVIGYSICTIFMLLALALIQILYLKQYFRAKKMI
ncbi:hypothetical protein SteCoe_36828 [Stentor coeruleus]|uniref:GOLD domain-containing protein n=1 Tax=Stentor coeruleus TaxID=5963 RepID=A0A1R2APC0_9CILI|nr:hypothetical protein SteCoe_36828 [Stentor coeruleus]